MSKPSANDQNITTRDPFVTIDVGSLGSSRTLVWCSAASPAAFATCAEQSGLSDDPSRVQSQTERTCGVLSAESVTRYFPSPDMSIAHTPSACGAAIVLIGVALYVSQMTSIESGPLSAVAR